MANLCKRRSSHLGMISMKFGAPLLCTLLMFAFSATVTTASMRRTSSHLHGAYTAPSYDDETAEFNNIPSAGLEEERAEEEAFSKIAETSGQKDSTAEQVFLDVTPRVPSKNHSSYRHHLDEGDTSYEDNDSSSDDEEDYDEHGEDSDEEDQEMDEEDNVDNSYNSDHEEEDSDEELEDDSDDSEMHNASFLQYAEGYYEPGYSPVNEETEANQVISDNIQEAGRNLKRSSLKGIRKAVIAARKGGRALQDGVQHGAKAIAQRAFATKEKARKRARAAIDRVRNRAHKTKESLKKGLRYMKKLPERAARKIVRGTSPAWSRARHALKSVTAE